MNVELTYDWMGSRLRTIGGVNINYDRMGSRPISVGRWILEYDRMWYIDLVDIHEVGDTVHVVDHYVDFIVGPPGLPYRILDLHELGEAMISGKLTPQQVAHILAATQTFADRHLQGKNHHGPQWPDFPPAAISPLRDIAIPPQRQPRRGLRG